MKNIKPSICFYFKELYVQTITLFNKESLSREESGKHVESVIIYILESAEKEYGVETFPTPRNFEKEFGNIFNFMMFLHWTI